MKTKTYLIVYNGVSDFIIGETDHPETLIADLINEGYAVDDIQLYEASEVKFNTEKSTIIVSLDS